MWGLSAGTLLKPVCRWLLKRLGDLTLGDLDLDQLDLQLTRGTLQLSDLALNADFINAKLSGSPITVKEGSIKSLLVKLPLQLRSWKVEIVVEGLEFVLAPSVASEASPVDTECSVSAGNSDTEARSAETKRNEPDSNPCSTSASRDVDDGVKRIANAIKQFLTRFNIKLKNTYVVFDPQSILDKRALQFNRSLVFRTKEIQCGTNLSTDSPVKLNNLVTFQEAVIEFLKMDDVDANLQNDLDRGTADISSNHSTTAVLTSPIGGFSGTLNLSIPWNSGCLNFQKIDADISVDSLELQLQMSSIQWFMDVYDSLCRNSADEHNCVHSTADMSMNASRASLCASTSSSSKSGSASAIASGDGLSQRAFSRSRQDNFQDGFLNKAHVIQDWIPGLGVHSDQGEFDSDCDESISQFFECFEELRSSHTNLGNSGIWDWTCSVFNAITFASALASGSDQVPKETLIEKTLRASIAQIGIILLFSDEMDTGSSSISLSLVKDMRSLEMFSSCLSPAHFERSMISPASASSLSMHHLEYKCHNIHLDLETYPKNLRLKASIGHMRLDEYYSTEKHDSDHTPVIAPFLNSDYCHEVQAALPSFPFAAQDYWVESSGYSSNNSSKLAKVELLKTFGDSTFHYDVSSTDRGGNSVSSTSLSICLASLVWWVHFHTVHMLLNFISKIESDAVHGKHKLHMRGDTGNSKLTTKTNISPSGSLKVQMALSRSRVIICFPTESPWDLSRPSILDTFLVIDRTSSLDPGEASSPFRKEMPNDAHSGIPSTSLHLAAGNFDIYLLRPMSYELDDRSHSLSRQTFFALKIISVTSSNCSDSSIKMIWRKYPVTDPEMVSKAWSLPNLHDQKITQRERGNFAGVSSYTTSQDLEKSSYSIRQELLQSTECFLHIKLSSVSVHLNKKDCGLLNQLLDCILSGLSNGAMSSSESGRDKSMPINDVAIQSAITFECSFLDICTELNETVVVGPLLQTELEGSWNCFKLSISKISLCSFSNVGGINNASFLWVNHGEGELWGSVTDTNDKTYAESKVFLLVVCKDSANMRGDGEGNNALSFGTSGCSVTHIRNPNLQEDYTSASFRSGTIVAPGGRMDWINAMCLLFNAGSRGTEQSNNSKTGDNSCPGDRSSFFLELVDVAVSYESHVKTSTFSAEAPDCKSFSCILAASSFKLHSISAPDSAATDFDIQLRDLGLFICESFGSKNATCGYGVDYLHKMGYTKIARDTFIEAALRIDTSFWKLEISDSQFDIGTCCDTTHGLICLCSQLQNLYAPDMRDALVHLQSRWNSVQQANNHNMASDASDKSESSIDNLAYSGECLSDGLLDDIIENAFYTDQDYKAYNFSSRNCHNSPSSNGMNVESESPTPGATDASVSHILFGSSLATPKVNTTEIPLKQDSCHEQIIDSYYMPDLLQTSSSTLCNVGHQCISVDDAYKTMEFEHGGWYNSIPLTIVESHVPERNNPQGGHVARQEGKPTVCSLNYEESCYLKGKVIIHDVNVNWRMYAGDDWSLAQKDVNNFSSSSGRNMSSSLEFLISGLGVQFDMYPDGGVSVSKLSISARDINLCDQRVDAPWKMVLGCYDSDYPRESCSSAFTLELECVKPELQTPLEDYRLCLEILPLQLHLDQGQLKFLMCFFQNDSCDNSSHLPCKNDIVHIESTIYGSNTVLDEALLPFFQKFDVKPIVLHINYIPRQFDPVALGKGNYAELLNILPLKGIDLKLKHVSAMGLYGWNSICETVGAEWLEDISKNQVHKLLKGLPPLKSVSAVVSGTKKLISLPIESYKKDRKLVKGMQRGAVAFIRSVSIEAVGLGVHLAAGAHDMLLKAEHALTALPPPLAACEAKRNKDNVRANQPENATQGIKQAYESFTDGLGRTASALIGNPINVYNRGAGARSALTTAICGAPAAVVAPVSATARAVHYALLGIRNSLDPRRKKESMYKYLGPSQL
ncbi:autophagy-related protein 2-like [Triticum dicoccoides]|uniref:autophagy-related protein 2-like n=1 Tax=Triticum dicoccoides TaxID=85692 RepID=UPI001890D324|nr:autophagy-related protein 2-like [Triticum dicoccoides]